MKFRSAWITMVLALAPALGLAQQTTPIPIEALSRQPAIQSVSMTPDGKHLVALIPSPANKDMTALATWDIDQLKKGPTVITPSGEHMRFVRASALKTGKILVTARQEWTGKGSACGIEGKSVGATKTFIYRTYLTDLAQKKFDTAFKSNRRKLSSNRTIETCLQLVTTSSLESTLKLDPDNIIISRTDNRRLTSNYYRYNLKTGKSEILFHGTHKFSPALLDPRTGKVLARSELDAVPGGYEIHLSILDETTGKFVEQPALTNKLASRHVISLDGRDDASGKYYVLTDQFSDKVQVRLYDPVAKKYDPDPVLADAQYSIGGLIFSRRPSNFNQIVGYYINGPTTKVVYLAPKLKAIRSALNKTFPDQRVYLNDYTDDLSTVLFHTVSASHSPTYFLLKNKRIIKLGSKRPWIDPANIGTQKWVTYTARDGMQIPAILDLPAGWHKGDKAVKAVINPHGGPWARDHTGWDVSGWVPLLTSRGYAVLRPQYRGSEGLGRKLWLAGDAQWGLKMSDDLDDGAAWLVKQGIAQKDHIAIFGYSYGGFAAVAASVRSPSPFQCAIAGAPVANLGRLGTTWSDSLIQRLVQGHTVKGMDPMQNTDKIHMPILLFGGDRDVRVPPYHPRDFYEAIKDSGYGKYVVIPDMPHSMPWYPRQAAETDKLVVDFLANDCFNQKPQH